MPFHPTSIRFLHPWRGRESGSVNSELGYGLMETLVNRKIAEWCRPDDEPEDDQPAKPKRRKK